MADTRNGQIDAQLREIFADEIAAQQGQCPSLALILGMAAIDERNRARSRVENFRAIAEALALAAIAGLLAYFWGDLVSGLESLPAPRESGLSPTALLGLAAALLTALLLWPRSLIRAT